MKRLPFGWKYLPVICQRLLGSLVRDLIPPDVLLIHYLDDFLLVARDRVRLREVTGWVAAWLREAKFLVSPKITLEPTDSLHCLGTLFDVGGGIIANTQFCLAQLVLALMRLSVTPYTQRCLKLFMGCNGLCSPVRVWGLWWRAPLLGWCGVGNVAMGYLQE